MIDNDNAKTKSGFHRGEEYFQDRVGVKDQLAAIGKKAIHDFMPEGHQVFFSLLPMLFVAAKDKNDDVWSSVLIGAPGFITFNNENNFQVKSQFTEFDPLANALGEGSQMGLLGIACETRRRNRVSTKITEVSSTSFTMQVKQCFGNCPKYIQLRKGKRAESVGTLESRPFDIFTKEVKTFIAQADTLFIASQHIEEENSNDEILDEGSNNNQGFDSSHRGGMPGFVQVVDENTLLIPDYIGNNFFNTLGNIELNPKVGIQFLDFENGHRLMMTGTAEVIWADDQELPFDGVDRMIKFTLKHGVDLKNCVPYVWDFQDYSPFSKAYKSH